MRIKKNNWRFTGINSLFYVYNTTYSHYKRKEIIFFSFFYTMSCKLFRTDYHILRFIRYLLFTKHHTFFSLIHFLALYLYPCKLFSLEDLYSSFPLPKFQTILISFPIYHPFFLCRSFRSVQLSFSFARALNTHLACLSLSLIQGLRFSPLSYS